MGCLFCGVCREDEDVEDEAAAAEDDDKGVEANKDAEEAEGPPEVEVATESGLRCEVEDEDGAAIEDDEAEPEEVEVGELPDTPDVVAPTSCP